LIEKNLSRIFPLCPPNVRFDKKYKVCIDMKVTLLICTLNEIDGMKAVMPKIDPKWVDEILIIDGGSTDGTVEYAKSQGFRVVMQKNRGLRRAYAEALEYISGDVVIAFSPDGNSLPEAIPQLVAKAREGYDLVMASRYAPGAHSDDDDWLTGFGNWMFPRLVNLLYGTKFTDVLGMYRAWRVDMFKHLGLADDNTFATEDRLFRDVIGCEVVMSLRVAKKKLKYIEIAASEPKRLGGQRKLRIFTWGSAHLFQIFRELLIR